MGQMTVLNRHGDINVEWDPKDAESVEKAKGEWERLKADGYEFYESVETKGKRLTRWNKNAAKVIAAPGVRKAEDKKEGKRTKAMAGGPRTAIDTTA